MKVAATSLFLALLSFLSVPLAAQPIISYPMPDIVAPGMNVYLELIGPNATPGNFGADGLYENNPTDPVRVELVNAADAATVAIGPVVVSWEGKLISTQLFVTNNRFAGQNITLRVFANGTYSAATTINVVAPQTLGTGGLLTGGGQLGSGGAFGTRSPRGVMIVNSLTLENGTYTVSTAGNNYYPLILLSKGPVEIRSNATLNVNASGKNAGPGGGGGGGRSVDVPPFPPGVTADHEEGGAGYTGGSGGARNTSGNERKPSGPSTGPNGTSANGALGGYNQNQCFEGGAGGTGHPFGIGGQDIWCGAGNPSGGYGGGTFAGQQSGGGGGGFRTNGGNGQLATNNGGKTHGNIYGVPVAGGSGAASGNPQAISGGSSGEGGGAGGAIVIYSMSRLRNDGRVEAVGGNGGAPRNATASGGGGSGGYVALGAKVPASNGGTGSVAGGLGNTASNDGGNGGNGLVRGDGLIAADPSMSGTGGVQPFLGATIDSLTHRDSAQFTLTGTIGAFPRTSFRIYMKSDAPGATWQSLGSPTLGVGRFWQLPVTVTTAGTYYFAILQDVSAIPQGDGYNRRPDWVMSQAGANIVRVDLIPKFNTNRTPRPVNIAFRDVSCAEVIRDSVKIWNSGDAVLTVTPSLTGGNAGDFRLLNPGAQNLNPRDTVYLYIAFTPTSAGTKTTTLRLTNNDPRAGQNPWDITLTGRKLLSQPALSDGGIVDFGAVCLGTTPADRTISLTYTGDANTTLAQIIPLGPDAQNRVFEIIAPAVSSLPRMLSVGGNIPITVRFRPTAVRQYSDSFRLIVGGCDTLTLRVRGNSVQATIVVTPQPDLDFLGTRINMPKTLPFTIENTGASPVRIRNITIIPAGPFTLAPGLVGTTIAPGATATGNVTFLPTVSGDFTAQLCVEVEEAVSGLCPTSSCINLKGRGVTSLLVLSDRTLILAADTCADPAAPVTRTFQLTNQGAIAERVTGVSTANGRVTVTSAPGLPVDLGVDESITFTVTWNPGATGTQTEQVIITTTSPEPAQQRMVVDLTLVRERSLLSLLDAAGTPVASDSTLIFPYVFNCNVPQTRELIIRNAGTLAEGYTARLMRGAPYSFTPAASTPIAAGADLRMTITFAPTVAGEYLDTLEIVSAQCGVVMRIALQGGRYDLRYTVSGMNFGPSNVGVARTGAVTIAFDSTTPNDVRARIAGITLGPGTGPEFTITTPALPVDLAPKEALTVPVEFTPTAEQAYSGTVCFQLTEPCDTTICVDLNGVGIQSSILVRKSLLDFGVLYICEEGEQELLVENTGSAPLQLQNLILGGSDAGAFDILEPLPGALPIDIAPGGSQRVRVRFVPARAGSDGLKEATLTVVSNDAAQSSIEVRLVGERRQQILAIPIALNFGRVEVGTTAQRTVTLENRSADPLTINSLTLPAPFRIVNPTLPPDIVLPPGGSVIVTVEFTPVDTNLVDERMLASQTSPCTDVTSVPVTGQGKITEQGSATVSIPDSLKGRPGQNLRIPFVLDRSVVLAETGTTTFRATVRFRNSMLVPVRATSRSGASLKPTAGTAVSGGRIVSSVVEGDQRVVTVEITNDPMLTAPDTLGFLNVTVALGDELTTPISFDSLTFTDGEAPVSVTTDDGFFTLEGYCTIGGNRLIEIGNSTKIRSVSPNPSSAATEIIYETNETGPTTLSIFDATGSLVTTLVDREELPCQIHLTTWNVGDAASGVYFVVLQTPTQRSSQRIVVVK